MGVLKVLISAYDCAPGKGSENEIGWSVVHELAKLHDVWVLTRSENRVNHTASASPIEVVDNIHFIYYDIPIKRKCFRWGKLYLIHYYLWQVGSYFEVRRFLKTQPVDFVHHLTKNLDWMPSGLALVGIPFLWGPVGSEETHPAIMKSLPLLVKFKERIRNVIRFLGRNLDPLTRLTGRRAMLILSHTPEYLSRRFPKKIIQFVQTGIYQSERFVLQKKDLARRDKFNVIFAGELVHWKGAMFAVEAFLNFARERPDAYLTIIGDGPLRRQMEEKVTKSSIADRVKFLGRVPMNRLIAELAEGEVFLYPSYHHGLATVVLQAMLTGLPIVCLEGDATGRIVGSECGITVHVDKDTDIIGSLSSALAQLYNNENLRIKFAKQAQEKVTGEYTYQVIGARYNEIYQEMARLLYLKNSKNEV